MNLLHSNERNRVSLNGKMAICGKKEQLQSCFDSSFLFFSSFRDFDFKRFFFCHVVSFYFLFFFLFFFNTRLMVLLRLLCLAVSTEVR